jgi:integrase
MLPVAVESLRAHYARQLEDRFWVGSNWQASDPVFATYEGQRSQRSERYPSVSSALEKHGFRYQRVHNLRHACASSLAASGVPLRTVSEILGHSPYQLTADLYEHVYESVTDQAAR